MSQSELSPEAVPADPDTNAVEYRPVSMLAVLTILLGLSSALALTSPVLLVLPGLTMLMGWLAWRSINLSEGSLAGRNVVIWGMVFAAFFAAMSISRNVSRRMLAVRDAREITDTFISLLLANEPQKAHQLQYLENIRQPPGASLWLHYRTTGADYDSLRTFVDAPLIHTLLALGKKAKVRYYDYEDISEAAGRMYVVLLYTVTYEQDGKPHTFFARFIARRDLDLETNILSWSIDNYEAGVKPYESSK